MSVRLNCSESYKKKLCVFYIKNKNEAYVQSIIKEFGVSKILHFKVIDYFSITLITNQLLLLSRPYILLNKQYSTYFTITFYNAN